MVARGLQSSESFIVVVLNKLFKQVPFVHGLPIQCEASSPIFPLEEKSEVEAERLSEELVQNFLGLALSELSRDQ